MKKLLHFSGVLLLIYIYIYTSPSVLAQNEQNFIDSMLETTAGIEMVSAYESQTYEGSSPTAAIALARARSYYLEMYHDVYGPPHPG